MSQSDVLQMPVAQQESSLTVIFALTGFDVDCALDYVERLRDSAPDGQVSPWSLSRLYTDALVPPVRRYFACAPVREGEAWDFNSPPRMGSLDLDLGGLSLPERGSQPLRVEFRFPSAAAAGADTAPPGEGSAQDNVVQADVRRISLGWFNAGDSSSAFLAVQLLSPAADLTSPGRTTPLGGDEVRSEVEGMAWSLGDVVRIRHAVSYLGAPGASPTASRPENADLFSLAEGIVGKCPPPVGNVRLTDDDLRPFVLCAVVVPDLPEDSALGVADILRVGLPYESSMGRLDDERQANESFTMLDRRPDGSMYFSNYTGAGLVSPTTASSPRFVAKSLPLEFPMTVCFLLLLALHQRLALLSISRRLGALKILKESSEDEDGLAHSVDEVGGIERDFQRLIAWTTFHEVSTRQSHQEFYSSVHDSLGIDSLMSEARESVTGAARLLSSRLSDDQRVDRNRIESLITGFGLFIAGTSLIFGFLSINIAGVTSGEGLSLWALLVALTAVILIGAVLWLVFRKQRGVGTRRK